jgi:small-conductance mechanosensitive channel
MSLQWKHLTPHEVEQHHLNQKGGLNGFIGLLFIFSILGMGGMSSEISQIYNNTNLDASQLRDQSIVILFAIAPYLVFAIALWSQRKKKTKNTLKIIIGILWGMWLVLTIHKYLVLIFIGFTVFPNELIAKAMGTFVLTVIATVGLLIYSYFSKVYNLQYLHRIKNENLDRTVFNS